MWQDWLRVLISAGVVIGVCLVLVIREREVHRTPALRALGLLPLLVGALVVAFVSWRVLFPPPLIAEAELKPGDAAVEVAIGAAATELLVHGKLGPDGKALGEGQYAVRATVAGKEVASYAGTLKAEVKTRKYMRRGRTNIAIMHLEGRHRLPDSVANTTVAFEVTKESGKLDGPLHLEIIPAAPRELPILIGGLVFALMGGLVDRTTKAAKTWLGMGAGMLFAFAVLLLEAPHPLELSHMARSVPVALILGAIMGGVMRGVAMLIIKTPPKAPPPKAPPATAPAPAG